MIMNESDPLTLARMEETARRLGLHLEIFGNPNRIIINPGDITS